MDYTGFAVNLEIVYVREESRLMQNFLKEVSHYNLVVNPAAGGTLPIELSGNGKEPCRSLTGAFPSIRPANPVILDYTELAANHEIGWWTQGSFHQHAVHALPNEEVRPLATRGQNTGFKDPIHGIILRYGVKATRSRISANRNLFRFAEVSNHNC
jgi:hypothetical protein